ncbi:bifunctional alpha,alpha-trehalose-phosphate synthase (UDP-forming)/trehalose-phosphatase [Paracnuella aquatica]|uniref:bifunctional alpha,alpha-trehalose-phosphate synthase (UDP-forming)/trehalose-phosphatase n=1 Tax=Paracnuella aquatica TaxID=2268757 RepID=UPI000DEFE42E|nr:bifunctional alpha,alpha-trehalose-phosphate synthase (UDP-forming)/trehalose-phosphatase [Paracnuella aquatica]RPD51651.1 bifunctional alpha,alpha-trehalose-phosphate synthase (UDP-forming)/trehalose-phosphatase [Paracnuella aquatica]
MNRLIIVSNRLPYSIERNGDEVQLRQSSGGLVSAIKSFFEKDDPQTQQFDERIWVGTFDAPEEDWYKVLEQGGLSTTFNIEPVFTDKDTYDEFYNGFSNSTLWPLFHYFPSIVTYERSQFDAYMRINALFAQKIKEIYRPGDVVWIHDYQLMALPAMVRKAIPDVQLGFFLHIPFPSYEIFRLMPTDWKMALLQGLLGADLIGFHTHDYVQHFIHSVKMALKVESQYNTIYYGNRTIKSDLFPIGIDFEKFRKTVKEESVVDLSNKLQERYGYRKIIFSVDRLDYTKGLNYRLNAYESFLETYPEWQQKIVFVFTVVPSRDLIPTYVERKRQIEEKVSTINGRFSTLDWQPILYRYNHISFEELCALYLTADIALITPLRDGMNLVAKEFVACCEDKGVLILSELTGAASELAEALQVNPTDTTEVMAAIQQALAMPPHEQIARIKGMQRRLSEYNVQTWIHDFLAQLQQAREMQEKNRIRLLDPLAINRMLDDYANAQKRCIMLDYDGTLAPIVRLPSMAAPGGDLLEVLSALSAAEENELIIISGRDATTLQEWLGHLPLTLVAEHGACIRFHGGEWQTLVTQPDDWKAQIRPILELFVNRCPNSFIEEKKNTLAWHYRNTDPDLGFNRSRELRNSLLQLTTNTPLHVVDGNKVIEVRLLGVDKGSTALNLINQFKPEFTLCIGDDTTDEDMFKALKDDAYTIKIGRGNTAARYSMGAQMDVLPLLRQLVMRTPRNSYQH